MDLSNKGSSPSVSPLSTGTKDEDTEVALNLSNVVSAAHPNDFFEHFRRAAAAAAMQASAGDGSASAVTPASAASSAAAAQVAATNLALAAGLSSTASMNRPFPGDIYRFHEDLETSGSAGSGGATTDEEGRFTCEKCDKTFTKQSSLSRHKYEHSGKQVGGT